MFLYDNFEKHVNCQKTDDFYYFILIKDYFLYKWKKQMNHFIHHLSPCYTHIN